MLSYPYLKALWNYTKQKLQECTFDGSLIAFEKGRNYCLIQTALDMIHDSVQREIILKCAWDYFITLKGDVKESQSFSDVFSVREEVAGHWKQYERCF